MFELPDLNYDYNALGKYISKDVMELHHAKHHQAYIDKLNKAVSDHQDQLSGLSVQDLISDLDNIPPDVQVTIRNNGGGHYNHSLFWQWMSPNGGGQPGGELEKEIINKYGSFQAFVDKFSDEALSVFGSGWVWLNKDLTISTTPNQDSPIMTGLEEPLLGLDVWEHAYYLDYQNRRADYINAWWNVVDWEKVKNSR